MLKKELKEVLNQDKILWYQKSRKKWIMVGYRNTKIFHASTLIHCQRNIIHGLLKDDGNWVFNLKKFATSGNFLLSRSLSSGYYSSSISFHSFPAWETLDLQNICKKFEAFKIHHAIFQMGPFKALRPDGFQPIFYQKLWELLGTNSAKRFSIF